ELKEGLRMRARYLYDPSAHSADRAAGRPHWPAYTPLMLEPIGLAARPIDPGKLAAGGWEDDTAVLFLTGPFGAETARLQRWVEGGGLLVAWGDAEGGSPGLDALLGVRDAGAGPQQSDEYAVSALVALLEHPLTDGVASPLAPRQP